MESLAGEGGDPKQGLFGVGWGGEGGGVDVGGREEGSLGRRPRGGDL